jgi:hypothetical protein
MAYPEPPSTPDSADALVAGVQSDPDVWLLYCAVGGRAQEEICAGGKTRGPTRHFFHGHTHDNQKFCLYYISLRRPARTELRSSVRTPKER